MRGLVGLGPRDPSGMRRQEALVGTAGTAAEAGRDGEQPRPPGLGRTGGPQEPRQPCKFSYSFRLWPWGPGAVGLWGISGKTEDPREELDGDLKISREGVESRYLAKTEIKKLAESTPDLFRPRV